MDTLAMIIAAILIIPSAILQLIAEILVAVSDVLEKWADRAAHAGGYERETHTPKA